MLKPIINSFLVLALSISTCFAALTAKLDRNPIAMGESINLTLSTTDEIKGQPDLSALNHDFTVMGTSNSKQISIINGKQSRTTQWNITLMPKKTGALLIPGITIGTQKTQVLHLTVNKSSPLPGNSRLFLQATVDPKTAYVGSQVKYIVKLFYAIDGLSGALLDPDLPGATPLGNDMNYQVTKNGKVYNVVERHYVFFPSNAGKLSIPGIVFSGQEPMESRQGNSVDQLFQITGGKPIRTSAPTITLPVNQKPSDIAQSDWFPANAVSIKQSWSGVEKSVHAGDPITRTIRIRAVGQPGNKIPAITQNKLANINHYGSQPQVNTVTDGNNVIGTRVEKMAYIPTQAGNVILPAITINWFNTEKQKIESSTLAAMPLTVLPAQHINTPPTTPSTAQKSADQVTPLAPLPQKIMPTSNTNYWLWLVVIILTLAWIITLLVWFLSKRRHQPVNPKIGKSKISNVKQARQAVRQACNENDARQLAHHLLDWARYYWPQEKTQNLGDISTRAIHPDFHQAIDELAATLYQRNEALCDGHAFWLSFVANEKSALGDDDVSEKDNLPPLHPR